MPIFDHILIQHFIGKNRQFLGLAKLLYECHTMMTMVQKSIKMTHRMYFYTWVTFLTWSGRSIGRFVNLVKIKKIGILAKISIFCQKFGFSPNYRGDLRMRYIPGNPSGSPPLWIPPFFFHKIFWDFYTHERQNFWLPKKRVGHYDFSSIYH